jgi:hypothetical protein
MYILVFSFPPLAHICLIGMDGGGFDNTHLLLQATASMSCITTGQQ